MTQRSVRPFAFFSLLATGLLLIGLNGCATSRPAGSSASQANVLGTWTYRTSGASHLTRGILQLRASKGRLTGQLRDAQLGTVPVDARLYGERLTLRLDVFRIGRLAVSGEVHGNEFRGLVERPRWDVSMDATMPAIPHDRVHGSFLAQRNGAAPALLLTLNCPTLSPDGVEPCR